MEIKLPPKPITLRKSIRVYGILGALIILLIIGYNFAHSQSVKKEKKVKESEIKNTITQAMIPWYEQETKFHNDMVDVAENSYQVADKATDENESFKEQEDALKNGEVGKEDFEASSETLEKEEEIVEAMKASITSNQLVAEPETHESLDAFNPMDDGEALHTADAEQRHKKGFLEKNQQRVEEELSSFVREASTPYTLQAGTIIPGLLMTGINSDLPGQLIGQVRSHIYDSTRGEYVLIPQGAKLVGLYDSQIAYGQERVLIIWQRILFPNGSSLSLQGMPGVDLRGYAGFKGKVNNHYNKLFSSVLLMSVLGAGAQLSQPQTSQEPWSAPSVGQTLAQSLGTQLSETAMMVTSKNLNIQPTLEIQPGYSFNIIVTKDIVFEKPYAG